MGRTFKNIKFITLAVAVFSFVAMPFYASAHALLPQNMRVQGSVILAQNNPGVDIPQLPPINNTVTTGASDPEAGVRQPDADTSGGTLTSITGVLTRIEIIINYLIPFLIGLAVFLIMYGILGFIANADNEEKRAKAKEFIVWGIIGVFFMMSVWGIVYILVHSFETNNASTIVTDVYKPQDAKTGTVSTVTDFVDALNALVSYLIPFLFGLAVLVIIYGILGYISGADNEEKRGKAKEFIMYGIFGIFIMLSVWGLVNILAGSFKLNNSQDAVKNVYPTMTVPTTKPATLMDFLNRMTAIGSYILPFLFFIALFVILLGIFNYIRQGDNEEARAKGRQFIIWGVVSLFMMLSIWGFVNILLNSSGLDNTIPSGKLPVLPTIGN